MSSEAVNILGIPIAALNMDQAADQIEHWVERGSQVYVCVTGVHGIMESQRSDEIRRIHQAAGMCVPDGMPTVWLGHLRGHRGMGRVYGPDLMLEVLRRSAAKGYTHFFYGGKDGVAELLSRRLTERLPGLKIVGTHCPPFRPLTAAEDYELVRLINDLSPDIVWVGLSTPKQETWMAAHIGKLNTRVMIGVGAAFDLNAGLAKRAPWWMQRTGLEWLFRLCMEPRRLWRRYLVNNPAFVCKVILQLTGLRKYNMAEGGRRG